MAFFYNTNVMWRALFVITLVVILAIWVFSCFYFVKVKPNNFFQKTWLVNLVFVLTAFICYIIHLQVIYLSVGFNDWNFQNAMPYANVSPFLFAITPLTLLLPKNIRQYYFNLVSSLTIAMIISPIANIIYNISINYKYHASFLLDYVPHLILSIWGIYIIQSGQVELKVRSSIISGLIIIGVALTMMILNVIFDKSFFGLSLNGKHNIYNQQLVKNSYLSALIYFTGLVSIMIIGYLFHTLLNHFKKEA